MLILQFSFLLKIGLSKTSCENTVFLPSNAIIFKFNFYSKAVHICFAMLQPFSKLESLNSLKNSSNSLICFIVICMLLFCNNFLTTFTVKF